MIYVLFVLLLIHDLFLLSRIREMNIHLLVLRDICARLGVEVVDIKKGE